MGNETNNNRGSTNVGLREAGSKETYAIILIVQR